MKISAAQTKPVRGDIAANIEAHEKLIALAASSAVHAIFFPELSVTGYEPELARGLATRQDDMRLDVFQHLCDINNITIGIGIPTTSGSGILISMVIFQPGKERQSYSKQHLHADELPFFVEGNGQTIVTVNGLNIAPAICYESLQPIHAENARRLGAGIYVASVAKAQEGVGNAQRYYPEIAEKYSMPVLMANCVGRCDNFESAGKSSVWNREGVLVGELDDVSEGLVIYDTGTDETIERYLDAGRP